LQSGANLVSIEVNDNPWFRVVGSLDPNDPMVQEWEEIIRENRPLADEDPDFLRACSSWIPTH
jgi:hypothetical protein